MTNKVDYRALDTVTYGDLLKVVFHRTSANHMSSVLDMLADGVLDSNASTRRRVETIKTSGSWGEDWDELSNRSMIFRVGTNWDASAFTWFMAPALAGLEVISV